MTNPSDAQRPRWLNADSPYAELLGKIDALEADLGRAREENERLRTTINKLWGLRGQQRTERDAALGAALREAVEAYMRFVYTHLAIRDEDADEYARLAEAATLALRSPATGEA